MEKSTIKVLMSSVREGRNGEKVLKWFKKRVIQETEAKFEFIDLKEWNLPMFSESISPAYVEGEYKNKLQQKWSETIKNADGYIIITPEYNHSYPASIKNALDYLYHEWTGKPIGFVSYGGSSGGIRAVEHLRTVSIELYMKPIRNEVNIPLVWQAFDEKGEPVQKEMIEQKTTAMLKELITELNKSKKAKK